MCLDPGMFEGTQFVAQTALSLALQKRVRRDASFVVDAYDSHWRDYERYLERAQSLAEWLKILETDRSHSFCNRNGKLVNEELDTVAYYREVVREAIVEHFPSARSVTEYGCGVGRNVLALQAALKLDESYGYELSTDGVEIASRAAAKFGLPTRYSQIDYVRDSDDKLVFPATDVAITMFSLEQVPMRVDASLHRMLARARLGSVHVEPVPEHYPLNARGLVGRLYSWKHDYLQAFPRAVASLKGVRVHRKVLRTSHNPFMYPSVYVIEKAR
jgi:hypothetical protein